jgi:hypothetical protein
MAVEETVQALAKAIAVGGEQSINRFVNEVVGTKRVSVTCRDMGTIVLIRDGSYTEIGKQVRALLIKEQT